MRYFFFLPGPESSLARCVFVPAPACQSVARTGSAQALLTSNLGARTGAVQVASVAVATDIGRAITARAVVAAGTGQHQHEKADEGWI